MKYMEQESSGSKNSADELDSDRDLVDTELFAVIEYLANLKDMCVANDTTYEEKSQKRVRLSLAATESSRRLGPFCLRAH